VIQSAGSSRRAQTVRAESVPRSEGEVLKRNLDHATSLSCWSDIAAWSGFLHQQVGVLIGILKRSYSVTDSVRQQLGPSKGLTVLTETSISSVARKGVHFQTSEAGVRDLRPM